MISVKGVIARPALQRKSEGRHRASVGERGSVHLLSPPADDGDVRRLKLLNR